MVEDKGQVLDHRQRGTCSPPCGEGECCVSVPLAMVSRKRDASLLPAVSTLYSHSCQPLKRVGERCLLRNLHNEWCDCAPSLACTHADDVALNNFFGVCQ